MEEDVRKKPLNLGTPEERRRFIERACDAEEGCISAGGFYVEMAKSLTLNDFATCQADFPERFKPSFEPGETEIWYRVNSRFANDTDEIPFFKPKPPTISDLDKSHVLIGKVAESSLETIFVMMQAHNWQPFGSPPGSPAAMFLANKGAEHSSMSVGDVVKIGNEAWMVVNGGWQKIEP